MQRHRAYKTELDPTDEQKETLRQWCGIRRWVYNWGLARRKTAYEWYGETLSLYEQDKELTQLYSDPPPLLTSGQPVHTPPQKAEVTPDDIGRTTRDVSWLRSAPRRVLYYALKDLNEAFQHFFRRVKNGEGAPGYPRFKVKGRSESFTVYGTDIRVEPRRIRLPRLGWIRLKEKGWIPLTGLANKRPMECTVSKRGGRWWVSVSVEEEVPRPDRERSGILAVHPGVRQWVTVMDEAGRVRRFDGPRPFREYQDKLAYYQRELAKHKRRLKRKQPGSNRYIRQKGRVDQLRGEVARIHFAIARIRQENTHRLTHLIIREMAPERILLQKWDVRQMMRQAMEDLPREVARRIRGDIADANMGEMIRQLTYKAEWEGVDITWIDPEHHVSERCSRCGSVNEDLGAEHLFRCPSCGHREDRETNACRNYFELAALDSRAGVA